MKMKKVSKFKLWLSFLVLLTSTCFVSAALAVDLPTAMPEEVGLSAERLDLIDSALQADVDNGTMSGAVLLIARNGRIAYFKSFGMRDKAKGLPMEKDSIFRCYSMTKPITGVAAAMLMEEGKILLADPVSQYIPSFKDIKVVDQIEQKTVTAKDSSGKDVEKVVDVVASTRPPKSVMTIQDLIRHTSGLTYWFYPNKGVQGEYLKAGMNKVQGLTNAEVCEKLAGLPLLFDPGSRYAYSRAYDALGRVIEVASGKPLAEFFAERIFNPLGMRDTAFKLERDQADRLVFLDPEWALYIDPTDPALMFSSGGGGLVSTAMDYARFAQMLLNGGQLDGVSLLGPKTVEFLSADHLGPLGNRDDPAYVPGRGYGQGFGFYVRVDQGHAYFPGSVGEFYKGGAAGTVFWIDPIEDLIAVFMVSEPARREYYRFKVKSLIYQAIENQQMFE